MLGQNYDTFKRLNANISTKRQLLEEIDQKYALKYSHFLPFLANLCENLSNVIPMLGQNSDTLMRLNANISSKRL